MNLATMSPQKLEPLTTPGQFSFRCINHETVFNTTDRADYLAHWRDAHGKASAIRGIPAELPKPKRVTVRKPAARKPISVKEWNPEPFAPGAWVEFDSYSTQPVHGDRIEAVGSVGQVWSDGPYRGSVWVVGTEQNMMLVSINGARSLGFVEPVGLFDVANDAPAADCPEMPEELLGEASAPDASLDVVPVNAPIEHAQGIDGFSSACIPGVTSSGCLGECVERERERVEAAAARRAAYLGAYAFIADRAPDATPAAHAEWARHVAGGHLDAARAMGLGADAPTKVPADPGPVTSATEPEPTPPVAEPVLIPADEPASPETVQLGDVIEWRTWCGPTRLTVIDPGPNGVHLRSSDGFTDRWERLPAAARIVARVTAVTEPVASTLPWQRAPVKPVGARAVRTEQAALNRPERRPDGSSALIRPG